MRLIKQFSIILVLSLLGEILHHFIPLPVPASIYGLVLMLFCLQAKIFPLEAVYQASLFLIDIMPLMFIPAGVALLDSWGLLKPILIPFLVITLVSTALVMAVTGRVTQFFLKSDNRKNLRMASGSQEGKNE